MLFARVKAHEKLIVAYEAMCHDNTSIQDYSNIQPCVTPHWSPDLAQHSKWNGDYIGDPFQVLGTVFNNLYYTVL